MAMANADRDALNHLLDQNLSQKLDAGVRLTDLVELKRS